MQPSLFPTIVTSILTNAKIEVTQVKGDLIIGRLVGFKPYSIESGMRMCDGTRIIHKKNVK